MSVFRMLAHELWFRRWNALSAVVAVTVAVSVYVGMLSLQQALSDEARILMKDMGFNVLILPEDTNLSDFWAKDYADTDMPEEYIETLAGSKLMTIRHIVALLERKVDWDGRTVSLVGTRGEEPLQYRANKPPLATGRAIESGECWVGHELARGLDLDLDALYDAAPARQRVIPIEDGPKIDLLGKELQVTRVLREAGSKEDVTIFANLGDAQEMLGMPGRINTIRALECNCASIDRLAEIRGEIASILPGTQVLEESSKAQGRAEMRNSVGRLASYVVPAMLVVAAIWIGLLAMANVREREKEIGTLRALGWGSWRIGFLFLGKAVLIGLVGAVLGYGLGGLAAIEAGPRIFSEAARNLGWPSLDLLVFAAIGAPLLAALATHLPALVAVRQDPAAILTRE